MKSNNLTISIPTPRCKKNCPYCVSKMTGRVERNDDRFRFNMMKARTLADRAGVTNILVTSKGEVLDNLEDLYFVNSHLRHYPLEVQINGDRYLEANDDEQHTLYGYDIIALSFDHIPQYFEKRIDRLTRITFVITDRFECWDFADLIRWCKTHEIDQLSLRNPTIPLNIQNTKKAQKTANWIDKNTQESKYNKLIADFNFLNTVKLRKLNFGATVYDVEGISFTHFDYCVQDQNENNDIRSLIYMEDGHLYTSWSFKSSKIF